VENLEKSRVVQVTRGYSCTRMVVGNLEKLGKFLFLLGLECEDREIPFFEDGLGEILRLEVGNDLIV
jgi:hypothetical protein